MPNRTKGTANVRMLLVTDVPKRDVFIFLRSAKITTIAPMSGLKPPTKSHNLTWMGLWSQSGLRRLLLIPPEHRKAWCSMSASVLIWMISSFRWDIWFKVILFFLKSSGMYGICCLYCLLPFYQSILSSLRRSVTSTSSGAESSVKAYFFILQR